MNNTLRNIAYTFSAVVMTVETALAAPFISPKGGYSLTPPPGWQVDHSGILGTDVAVLGPPAANFRPNMNVVISPALPGQTLQGGRKQIPILYARTFPQFKMLSSGVGTMNGISVLNVLCTYLREGRRLRMRQGIALHDGHVYTFTFTAPDAAHARYDAIADQMLQSIRWQK